MKIKLLFIMGVCLFVSQSHAQDKTWLLGVDAGTGLSTARATDSSGHTIHYANQLSLYKGLNAEWRLHPMFSVRTGLYYTGMKSSYSNTVRFYFFTESVEQKISFTYLSLPLTFNFSYSRKLRYTAGLGPSLGLLLSQQTETTVLGFAPSHTVANYKDRFNSLNLGLTAHIGLGIPLANRYELSIGLRGNMGLSNMYKNPVRESRLTYNAAYLMVGFAVLL